MDTANVMNYVLTRVFWVLVVLWVIGWCVQIFAILRLNYLKNKVSYLKELTELKEDWVELVNSYDDYEDKKEWRRKLSKLGNRIKQLENGGE